MSSPGIMRRNNVTVLGTGTKTLVLAHGLGCDQRIWHKVVPLLSRQYRLVLFDYVGTGESDFTQYRTQRYADLGGYAQDLLDVVESLGLVKPYLLGHSASGSIGVLAEELAPGTFERLIMLGPSPRYINAPPDYFGGFERQDIDEMVAMMEKDYLQWAESIATATMQNEHRPQLTERLMRSFQQERPEIMLRFARAILYSDLRDEYKALQTPVSVLACSQDAIVPAEVVQYMQNHMQRCEVLQLEASGHYPQLSEPAEVVDKVRQVLEAERHA
ncbi:alpha/beta fold hydrolase [Aliidiomarina sp. Khilg15.8]